VGRERPRGATADPDAFRSVMAALAMPIAVIATIDRAGVRHGTTLGSLASLSLGPPLVMFALGHRTRTHRPVCEEPRFCLSILSSAQQEVAERFTGDPARRFGPDVGILDGLPAVDGALGWLVCTRHRVVEAGDHSLVIGLVERAVRNAETAGGPLVYHDRHYLPLSDPVLPNT